MLAIPFSLHSDRIANPTARKKRQIRRKHFVQKKIQNAPAICRFSLAFAHPPPYVEKVLQFDKKEKVY
jgi:hypothetical protein